MRLTVIGGLLTMVLLLITLPPASGLFPLLYSSIRPHLSVLLSSVLLYSLWADGSLRPLLTIALAGTLGVLALDNLSQPLFPMLTGLFGVSTLLYSLHVEMEVPVQNFMTERMSRGDYLEGSLAGYVSGMSLGILPGLGASQAAFLSQEMLDRDDVRTFLLAIGGVTTSDAVFSFLALWLIGNPRSGVAVAVEGVLEVGRLEVVGLVGAMCVAAVLGAVVALKSSSVLANRISRLDYRKVNLLVIAFLSLLVLSMRGMEGFLLMALSASVGLTAITSGVRRAYLMSALLVPTILFFAPV